MKNEKEKIKVMMPSRNGRIEVEGTVENIKELLRELGVYKKDLTSSEKKDTIERHILDLIGEGFFDEPKTLPEIREKLERKGYNYPSSSIHPVLLRKFVRKDILKRTGEKRNYKYYISESDFE